MVKCRSPRHHGNSKEGLLKSYKQAAPAWEPLGRLLKTSASQSILPLLRRHMATAQQHGAVRAKLGRLQQFSPVDDVSTTNQRASTCHMCQPNPSDLRASHTACGTPCASLDQHPQQQNSSQLATNGWSCGPVPCPCPNTPYLSIFAYIGVVSRVKPQVYVPYITWSVQQKG